MGRVIQRETIGMFCVKSMRFSPETGFLSLAGGCGDNVCRITTECLPCENMHLPSTMSCEDPEHDYASSL